MRSMRRSILWIVAGLAAALLVGRLFVPAPLEAPVILASRAMLRVTVDEPGITRIPRHLEISAPVSGRVSESTLEAGDSVSAGTVVAEIRPAPLDPRAAAEAQAAARAARAVREEAVALARRAALALDEAQHARARAEQIGASGGLSASEVEVAVRNTAMREDELSAAQARARAAAQDERRALAAARGSVSSQAGKDVVKLRAPFAGRVLRMFEQHDRVVAAGTPLLEVGDVSRLEVVIEVLSRDAISVAAGQKVLFQHPSGETVEGQVTRVEPAAFKKVSALGIDEQRVRVITRPLGPIAGVGDAFELPASIVIWEGQDVLTVPPSALVPVGEGWGVFVVRDGRAHRQPVEVGHRGSQSLEVTRGLGAGEAILLHPDSRVGEGTRIRPAP